MFDALLPEFLGQDQPGDGGDQIKGLQPAEHAAVEGEEKGRGEEEGDQSEGADEQNSPRDPSRVSRGSKQEDFSDVPSES